MTNLVPSDIKLHLPDTLLKWFKASLDVTSAIGFIVLLLVILYARDRYAVFKRSNIFHPLLAFSVLGTISMAMDAMDEFFWFVPSAFYNEIWKPLRLILFIFAVILLLYSFTNFYHFSRRILPSLSEEDLE